MNYIAKLLIWTISASLIMFTIYTWLPEWTIAAGVLVGYLSILIVHKLETPKNKIKDALLLTIFTLITVSSYLILLLACYYLPYTNQCGERSKNSLLLSNIFFIGAPIFALYVFDRIPRFLRNLIRR
jgi:hypothetical protein